MHQKSVRPVVMSVLVATLLLIVCGSGTAFAADTVPAAVVSAASDATCAAAPAASVDHGDVAWMLVSTALVMLMTPGLALFYGGLVRRKNILSVLMQCFIALCLISVQWVLFGYSLAFGPSVHGIIGSLSWAGLNGVTTEPSTVYASSPAIPHQLFMMFQMMFAVITPALIIGAFAERFKFSAFCVFALLWATLIYDPIAHWVWGAGGFLGSVADPRTGAVGMGAMDFAGGIVVHVNAGVAALAAALVLGRRHGFAEKISPPHNLPIAVIGAGLLWFGWFGFNAGSALAAGQQAVSALVATHISAAAAGLVWSLLDWFRHKRPTTLGMITGTIAGLAAVTPAAGFVSPMGAICIGVLSGVICWLSVTFIKVWLRYDDSLDAFGVHGVGGIFGTLATGFFATTMVSGNATNGLFYGNPAQAWIQLKAVLITGTYSFVVSIILLKLVDWTMGLRVSEQDERIGLDLTQHREAAYTVID